MDWDWYWHMMERCIRNQQYPTSSRQILSWQSLGSIISVRVSLLYLPPLFILQESIGSLVEEPCRLGNRWRAGRYADDFHAAHRVFWSSDWSWAAYTMRKERRRGGTTVLVSCSSEYSWDELVRDELVLDEFV